MPNHPSIDMLCWSQQATNDSLKSTKNGGDFKGHKVTQVGWLVCWSPGSWVESLFWLTWHRRLWSLFVTKPFVSLVKIQARGKEQKTWLVGDVSLTQFEQYAQVSSDHLHRDRGENRRCEWNRHLQGGPLPAMNGVITPINGQINRELVGGFNPSGHLLANPAPQKILGTSWNHYCR